MQVVDGDNTIYRDEDAHIADGELPGVDLANLEGQAWVAPFDWECVAGTGNDPAVDETGFHAGFVTVIECQVEDILTRFHYCHGQANEVMVGQTGPAGEVIGHVGHSGSVWDSSGGFQTVEAAHLHLWIEQHIARAWVRAARPSDFLAKPG